MRQFFLVVFVVFSFNLWNGVAYAASIPSEVMLPYKAYRTALEAENKDEARKQAKIAWDQAESLLGESKTTGDLALNFAVLAPSKYDKQVVSAFERAIELVPHNNDNIAYTTLEREVQFATYLLGHKKYSKARKRLRASADYAEANEMATSVFAGEIHTFLARIANAQRKFKKLEYHADKAVEIFETAKGPASIQPIIAILYAGYGKETQEDFISAALNYQEIMQNLEGIVDNKHPLAKRALGRWIHARNKIRWAGKYEEAEARGLCDCWPYDKERNENVKPIKRVPPDMPSNAYSSGFSIVEFDLNDDGSVLNPRILESWPAEIFDKSSLKAVEKWKFSPRTTEETDGDRKDIITTIGYKLTNQFGDDL